MDINYNRFHTALISVSASHKKCSMQEFQNLNLSTGQPKVLSVIYQKEGYLQKELAMRCHVEPATMTSLLYNLVKKDLIFKKQVTVSGGQRASAIYLTASGRVTTDKVNKIVEDVENISFLGFSELEKQLLIDLLNRVRINLENKIH